MKSLFQVLAIQYVATVSSVAYVIELTYSIPSIRLDMLYAYGETPTV